MQSPFDRIVEEQEEALICKYCGVMVWPPVRETIFNFVGTRYKRHIRECHALEAELLIREHLDPYIKKFVYLYQKI